MNDDKTMNMIGMATRAGKVGKGAFQSEQDIKTGKAQLVILAQDASDNTKKKFRNMTNYYEVDLKEIGQCASLGKYCKKEILSVITIDDENFKKAILQTLSTKSEG